MRSPSQDQLHTALAGATSLTVLAGGSHGGKPLKDQVLMQTSEPADLRQVCRLLAIFDDPEGLGHCLCAGDPTLVFEAPGSRVVISVHHGYAIRWNAWAWDAPLANGTGLAEWLAARGAPQLLHEMEAAAQRRQESATAFQDWQRKVPRAVRHLWDRDRESIRSSGIIGDVTEYRQALQADFPELATQVCVLLQWYGAGVGRWSGFPSYEALPRKILDLLPAKALLGVLAEAGTLDDPDVVEGAARYVLGWDFRKHRKKFAKMIYPQLSEAFLHHLQNAPGDPSRLKTAKSVSKKLSRLIDG